MSKICKECGCINENDNARFCNDCGAKFEDVTAPVIKLTEVINNSSQMPLKQDMDDDVEVDTSDVFIPNQQEQTAIDEDNEEDYVAKPVNIISQSEAPAVYDEDEDSTEVPIAVEIEKPVLPKKPKIVIGKKKEPLKDEDKEVQDMVTNDPYYDDVLPEINNERTMFNKEVFLKVGVAFVGMIFIMAMIIHMIG